ncbi:anthranilate synthase component I family protein [Maridesulfovibrio sp.]|uniref:chorismate-binding protein n=1 Tax=Maridesulfovibrio sp. TaxID=2795000 RepID=UPI002A18782F|nr:anthranilate synthase component I family protein [Maridesulfovibrio sp.]
MLLNFSNPVSFDEFRQIAAYFASEHGADVLLGAEDQPGSAKSYICIGPQDELVLQFGCPANEISGQIKTFAFADSRPTIGYVSYECGMALRGVEISKKPDYPYAHLKKYAAVLMHDAVTGSLEILYGDEYFSGLSGAATEFAGRPYSAEGPDFHGDSLHFSLDGPAYMKGVSQTLEHIRNGLTYQLNLTTEFTFPAGKTDPAEWFFDLNRRYPAPYYALLRSGERVIISTSPELFLRVEDGVVTSEPIKGTLSFDKYSEELVQKLTSSPKEDAELSMIVDLVRNDISANCRCGSVKVEDHKSVFAVDNMLQMFSRVRGELEQGRDCVDLFLDAFPGGSITGCPKKSSMQLIDSLEPHSRGIYCGSIVFINDPANMVASIVIRTAVHDQKAGRFTYWAGSGIVIDSDPEAEYLETLAKAGKFLDPEMR